VDFRKEEVEKWVVGSTYKLLLVTRFRNRRLQVEREDDEPVEKVLLTSKNEVFGFT
jgi:hypothetical protein